MDAETAVRAAHETFPVATSYQLIESLCKYDRYQASTGINEAADFVAATAERAGLSEVEIRHYPADGAAHWWTFRAPRAWTPVGASLLLPGRDGPERLVDLATQPFALATYSAPADTHRVPLLDLGPSRSARLPEVRGALVLVPSAARPPRRLDRLFIEDLTRSGARGLVTDIPAQQWRGKPEGTHTSGRLELPQDTTLYAFSVPPATMDVLQAAERSGVPAQVTVQVGRTAEMPVVHGVLPGAGRPDETWLTAHLCHPAPGANDNASGAATLLGVASALHALATTPAPGTVRFVWAPEFVGTAAFLFDRVHEGAILPSAVINLDMVGEDQARCGGPLTVEHGPAHIPSVLPAIADDFLHRIPVSAHSYARAVPLRDWSWSAVPFSGASDHSLFSDRVGACPALSIGHWPDRYRHSSLDTIDKVSPSELHRVGTLVGGLTQFLRNLGPAEMPYVRDAVYRWSLERMVAIHGMARRRGPPAPSDTAVLDPFHPDHLTGFLRHQVTLADTALASLEDEPAPARTVAALRRHADELGAAGPSCTVFEPSAPGLRRRWEGPFNFEGLVQATSAGDREWLLTQDHLRPSAYSEAVALALALGDGSSLGEVVTNAAYSTWLPIELGFAERLIAALRAADWVSS